MFEKLNELAAVLEEEIAVGDELRLNLAAQRRALGAWDLAALIAMIADREAWIRSLNQLEAERARLVEGQVRSDKPVTLRQLIMACPESLPARRRLQSARACARQTFLRLQADERDLNALMENLQCHLHEALKPLACPPLSLYSDSGTAPAQSPAAALIHNKA